MALRVRVLGRSTADQPIDPNTDLLCRALALAANAPLSLVLGRQVDLTVVYPYVGPFKSTIMGAGFESLLKRSPRTIEGDALLRRILRIPQTSRVLVVSPENLDRRPWEVLGHFLAKSEVPRLTFWPMEIDPSGFRFPYWWNYVDWTEIPRPGYGSSTRLGQLYELDQLASPRRPGSEWQIRLDRAVWLIQHRDFPRQQVLEHLSQQIPVDVLSNVPNGEKIDVLRRYKYCVVTENSTGYGYETEKAPDAVTAGCIPIGFIANPWSDFNAGATFFDVPHEIPEELPALLAHPPKLDGLLEYLATVLDQKP